MPMPGYPQRLPERLRSRERCGGPDHASGM